MTDPWSQMFVIDGPPASWKNSMGIVLHRPRDPGKGCRCPHCGKRVMATPIHSRAAREWMESAVPQLEAQWRHVAIPKSYGLELRLAVFFPTRRFADCTSIIDAVQDALQEAKVVENDIAIEPMGCGRFVDRRRPRIEATLSRKAVDK